MCFGAPGPVCFGGPGPVCFGARGPCALGPGARQPDGLYGASAALQAPCLLQHLHLRHCTSDIALHLRHGPTALHLRHCSSKSLQSAWNPATIPQAIPRSHSTTVRQRHSKSIYIGERAEQRLDEFFYYFNYSGCFFYCLGFLSLVSYSILDHLSLYTCIFIVLGTFFLFLGSFFFCCGVVFIILGRFSCFWGRFYCFGPFL